MLFCENNPCSTISNIDVYFANGITISETSTGNFALSSDSQFKETEFSLTTSGTGNYVFSKSYTAAEIAYRSLPSPNYEGQMICWVQFREDALYSATQINDLDNPSYWVNATFTIIAPSEGPDIGGLRSGSAQATLLGLLISTLMILN